MSYCTLISICGPMNPLNSYHLKQIYDSNLNRIYLVSNLIQLVQRWFFSFGSNNTIRCLTRLAVGDINYFINYLNISLDLVCVKLSWWICSFVRTNLSSYTHIKLYLHLVRVKQFDWEREVKSKYALKKRPKQSNKTDNT